MASRNVDDTTHEAFEPAPGREAVNLPALALMWSRAEPKRIGEIACIPAGFPDLVFTLGRADEAGTDGALPLVFQRLRPTSRVVTGPLNDTRVSRWHLRLRVLADGRLAVERLGRGALRIADQIVDHAVVELGALIEVVDLFTLLYTTRPAAWPRSGAPASFPFADADPFGIVGETPVIWRLREAVALVATRSEHVLVHGPSGAGKELVAAAVHACSPRGSRPRISRDAATLAGATAEAELFGNLQDFPRPDTPARAGLLDAADGGSLFLDFFDEVPASVHTRLLRAMDTGECQRLGEARSHTVDVRWIGATSQDPAAVPHSLRTRFIHHLRVHGLDDRREDIPLLVRHLLRHIVATSPTLRTRLFADDEPRVAAELVAALVRHPYAGHVRELYGLLWRAISASADDVLVAPPDLQRPAGQHVAASDPPRLAAEPPSPALTRERIVATLAACDGVRERAWRALGLRSRDQLKRLIKKHEIP